MTPGDTWSPDEPLGTESFEQADDAFDESDRIDPKFLEALQLDPSIDPALQVDDRELEETGAELDDPEDHLVLDGGMDDPDGIGGPTRRAVAREEDVGWDLDEPVAGHRTPEPELPEEGDELG